MGHLNIISLQHIGGCCNDKYLSGSPDYLYNCSSSNNNASDSDYSGNDADDK
jgi:hypothetical protein